MFMPLKGYRHGHRHFCAILFVSMLLGADQVPRPSSRACTSCLEISTRQSLGAACSCSVCEEILSCCVSRPDVAASEEEECAKKLRYMEVSFLFLVIVGSVNTRICSTFRQTASWGMWHSWWSPLVKRQTFSFLFLPQVKLHELLDAPKSLG